MNCEYNSTPLFSCMLDSCSVSGWARVLLLTRCRKTIGVVIIINRCGVRYIHSLSIISIYIYAQHFVRCLSAAVCLPVCVCVSTKLGFIALAT